MRRFTSLLFCLLFFTLDVGAQQAATFQEGGVLGKKTNDKVISVVLTDRINAITAAVKLPLQYDKPNHIKNTLKALADHQAIQAFAIKNVRGEPFISVWKSDSEISIEVGQKIPADVLSSASYQLHTSVDYQDARLGQLELYLDPAYLLETHRQQFSAEERTFIKDNPSIKVARFFHEPPLTLDQGDRPTGYLYELLEQILAQSGIDIEFVDGFQSYEAMLQAVSRGDVHVVTTLDSNYPTGTSLRVEKSKPVLITPYVLVGKRGAASFANTRALFGRKVAVVKGYAQDKLLDQFSQISKVYVKDNQAGFDAVRQGKAEYFLNNRANAEHVIYKTFSTDLIIVGELSGLDFPPLTISYGIHEGTPALLSLINNGLDALPFKQIKEIKQRWLSKPEASSKAVAGEIDLTGVANQMAPILGDYLWRYRADLLKETLINSLSNYKLQAAMVFDSGMQEYHYSWYENGEVKFQKSEVELSLPDTEKLVPVEHAIQFQKEQLGMLTLYPNVGRQTIKLSRAEQEFLKENSVIRFHNEKNWAPYNFNRDGLPQGYTIDLLNILAEKLGIQIEYVSGPSWGEFMQMLEAKEIDAVGNMAVTKDRLKFAVFTEEPIFTYQPVIVSRQDMRLPTVEGLSGKTVAIVKGFWYEEELRREHPSINLVTYKNTLETLKAVSFGEADATLGNGSVMRHIWLEKGLSNLILSGQAVLSGNTQFSNHIGIRTDWPLLASAFDKALRSVTFKEEQQLKSKWLEHKADAAKRISLNAEEKAFIKANPVIKVSNEIDYPPLDFAIGGEAAGYSVDLLKLIAERIGVQLQFVNGYSWDELWNMYEQGDLDLVHPVYKNSHRADLGLFSKPLFSGRSIFVSKIDQPLIQSIEDVNTKTLAVIQGSAIASYIQQKHPKITLLQLENIEECVQAVSEGRAYAAVEMDAVAEYTIRKGGYSGLKINGWFKSYDNDTPNKFYYLVRKDKPLLHQMIVKAQASITAEEIQTLQRRWFGQDNVGSEIDLPLTQAEQAYLQQLGSIKQCLVDQGKPIGWREADGSVNGIVRTLTETLSDMIRVPIEYQAADSGASQCDLHMLVTGESMSTKDLNYTSKFLSLPVVLATKVDALYFQDIRDLRAKKIGVVGGASFTASLQDAYPWLNLQTVDSVENGLQQVRNNQLFGLIDSMPSIGYRIQRDGMFDLKIAGRLEHTIETKIGVDKQQPLLLAIMQKAIDALDEQDKRAIVNQWVAVKYEQGIDYALVWKVLLAAIIVLMAIVYWNRRLAALNQRVRLANDALAETQQIAGLGSWELDAKTQTITLSREALRIVGINDQTASPSIQQYLSLVHADDRDKLKEQLQNALEGQAYESELRHLQADGDFNYILNRAKPVIADGQVTKVQGTVLDLTRLRQTELALKEEMVRRYEYEESLKKAKAEAESANRAKSEFLANISHEIRTPLNSVLGFSELLENTQVTPKQQSFLESIKLGGKTLLSLINDILDLSKIEAGKFTLQPEPTIIPKLFEGMQNIFKPKLSKNKLSFDLKIAENVPECLLVDEVRLRQVLFNLVGNAIKFTQEGGITITVTAQSKAESATVDLIIEVQDTGIGIPTDQQARIFNSFEQREGQSNRKYGGTGLGLSISSKLVHMMNGKLDLRSEEGSGATFTITLHNVEQVLNQTTASYDGSPSTSIVKFAPASLLIADDDHGNRQLIKEMLHETELTIIEAVDGEEVVALYQSSNPDLVVMNINMPKIDGIQAATRIKALADGNKTPIIAFTGGVDKKQTLMDTGLFAGFLAKPLMAADLINECKIFLSYEEIDQGAEQVVPDEVLPAMADVGKVRTALEDQVVPLWQQGFKSGVFDDILAFASMLKKVASDHQLDTLEAMASDIENAVDSFDIEAIDMLNNEFESMLIAIRKQADES